MQLSKNIQPTMSSRDIAALTGKQHSNVIRDIRAMIDAIGGESELNHLREEKDARGYTACFHLDRYHTEVLVTGYDVKRRAAVIKRWHDLESGAAKPIAQEANVPATMALVECAATLLNASDSGRIIMLRKAGQAVGADTSFLPDYTEDSAPGHVGAMDTASATQLLREHGVPASAMTFNRALESAGIIKRRHRHDRAGNTKGFWCITDAGMDYGKNIVSPQSPRETQPHYYRERFLDLLALAGMEGVA